MAKITFASPVDAVRGTVNGIVFSANKAGAYVRRRANANTTDTTGRQAARLAFADFATQWATITQSQRNDWDTWAALPAQEKFDSLGNSYYLTGYQSFIECNINRSYWHSTLQADAPTLTSPSPVYLGAWYAETDEGVERIGARTINESMSGREPVLQLAVRRSSLALTNSPSFFNMPIVPDVGELYTYWDVDIATYYSKFGAPDATHRIFFRGYTQRAAGNRGPAQNKVLTYTP